MMDIYWTLFFVAILVGFIVGETVALLKGGNSLSRFVWNLSKAWPPLPLIVGLLFGFVFSHFWWGGHLICY